MGVPFLAGAAASSGGGSSVLGSLPIVGGVFNAISQGMQNRKNRKFAREMYDLQRQHSLADWAMQNEYNSPEAQMSRLKAAGLNPNLVYGNGAVANSSSAPHEANMMSPNTSAPQIDTGSLFSPLDAQIKQEQLENLGTQRRLMETNILKGSADVAFKGVQTAKGRLDYELAQNLKQNVYDTASANLDFLRNKTEVMLAANERSIAASSMSLKEAAERILNYRMTRAKGWQEIANLKQVAKNLASDNTLKQLDIDLKKQGVQPTDNIFLRELGRIISGQGRSLPEKLSNATFHKKWVRPFSKEWWSR